MYSNHTNISYGIQIKIGKQKYVFMCDFGILSQGHALTITGNWTDLSKKTVNNFHNCVQ